MKKITFSFKSLLLAAGLLLGSANAWGGVVSTIYSKALGDWSSDDVTKTENTVNKWYNSTGIVKNDYLTGMMINATYGLRLAARNTTATATLTLDRTANTIVTIDAVWNVGSASADGNTPHTQFTYGDLMIQQNVRSNNLTTTYRINGETTTVGTDKFARQDDMTIHIKVNSTSGEISEFYIKNGATEVAKFADLTDKNNKFAAGSNYDAITMLSWISASSSYAWCAMKSLTVQQETQSVPTANVTFKYEDTEGNSLSAYKADQVASDVALGTEISTLIPSYNATFYNGDANKYVFSDYVVTGSYTTVQEGGNTVTMKFTNYPATAYAVKAQVSGSDLTTLATGTAYLDGSTSVFWNKYISKSGTWYKADETTFGTAITNATNNVAFTATDAVSYFFEAESMALSREYGSITNNSSYSGGGGKGVYASATLTSTSKVPAGIYTFSIGSVTRNASKTQSYKVSYSANGEDFTETDKTISFTTAAGSSEQSVAEVKVPAEAYIRLTEGTGGNASDYVDYVILKKTGEVVSVTEAGYATFSSPYALDLSSISGGTAYIVADKENNDYITLTEQTTAVPANTGLVIKCTGGGTVTIPVAESGTAPTTNYLVATNGGSVAEDNYVFAYVTSDFSNPGFYKLTEATTVPAGKAYLNAAAFSNVKAMFLPFDGTATGVEAPVAAETTEDGIYYNLNGQQVTKDYKGIVIVNGKKFYNK